MSAMRRVSTKRTRRPSAIPRTKKGTSNRPAVSGTAEDDGDDDGGLEIDICGSGLKVLVESGIFRDVLLVDDTRVLSASGVRYGLVRKLLF